MGRGDSLEQGRYDIGTNPSGAYGFGGGTA